jgi:hypothetical protein
MDTDHLWALVLAGGDGTRLQGLTRLIAGAPIPKQYCRILGDRSLLEMTLARVARLVPCERTLAIDAGLGHLPEIADGDPPHTPRGCPFQAWSVGEALRLTRLLA